MKTPGMLAKLAVVIAIASGAGAFAPALPSLAHVTSAATSIIAPNHCRLSGSSFGAQRHAGRETLSLRMTGKETPLSKVVADVEMNNALDPNKSLPERLEHTLTELTTIYDAIEADVLLAEEQLADKKNSMTLLKKRIMMIQDDLTEAKGQNVIEQTTVQAALILGGGKVGSLLRNMGHPDDVMVRSTIEYKYQLKEHAANAPVDGPIYLCVPTEEVPSVLAVTPEERKQDLVFMGTVSNKLEEQSEGTMAAVFFQIDKIDEEPQDPAGMTIVSGKWAGDFASRLKRAGVQAKIGTPQQLASAQLEYLVWLCSVHAVGKLHGLSYVEQVVKSHVPEFEAMMRELGEAGQSARGIQLPADYVQKLREYTAGLKARVVLKPARHELFWGLSADAKKNKEADPCPLHSAALKKLKVSL